MTTQHELTPAELEHIISQAGQHWTRAVVATFATFGIDLHASGTSISCSDYSIPEHQWAEIATACTREPGTGNRLGQAGAMLDWMNYGPGSYQLCTCPTTPTYRQLDRNCPTHGDATSDAAWRNRAPNEWVSSPATKTSRTDHGSEGGM